MTIKYESKTDHPRFKAKCQQTAAAGWQQLEKATISEGFRASWPASQRVK